MEFYAVQYGASLFPSGYVFQDDDLGARLPFAWAFFVVRAGGRTILVDTGFCDPSLAAAWDVTLTDPVALLGTLSITPADVTDILLTHHHFDHADNLDLFPAARVVAQADAWEAYRADERHAATAGRLERERHITTFLGEYAASGALRMEHVGGHSPGSAAVWVTHGGRRFVVPSDECYCLENVARVRPVGLLHDLGRNRAFLERLHSDDCTVLPFHDPAVFARYPHFAEGIRQIVP